MFDFLKKDGGKQTVDSNEAASKVNVIPNEYGTAFARDLYYANKGGVLFNYYVGRDLSSGIEEGDERHPDGVDANVGEAIQYLTFAAEREIRDAQTLLGLIYMGCCGDEYINDQEAFKWIYRSACAGSGRSQHILANMYLTGRIVEKNMDLFFKWSLLSATRANEDAMMDLCDYYRDKLSEFPEEMTGEEENEFFDCVWLSYKWSGIAAEYGEPRGMYMKGVALYQGFGVKEDKDEAKKYLEMALENGYEDAKEFLEENY